MLNPCPFCGSTKVYAAVDELDDGSIISYCLCSVCGSRGPSFSRRDAACAMWNRSGGVATPQPPRVYLVPRGRTVRPS